LLEEHHALKKRVFYNRFELSANERNQLLEAVFLASENAVSSWRVWREKQGECTLWDLFSDAALEFSVRGNALQENMTESCRNRAGESVSTASLVAYAQRRLEASKAKPAFDKAVDAVEPCKEEGTVCCSLCLDDFKMGDVANCNNANHFHTVCRPCFRQLCIRFASDKGAGCVFELLK